MRKFFPRQSEAHEINAFHERVRSLQQDYSVITDEQANLRSQLSEAQGRVYDLESHYVDKKITTEQKQEEYNRLLVKRKQLYEDYQVMVAQAATASQDRAVKERRLASLNYMGIENEYESLTQQINILDIVIGGEEPSPAYQMDGEYCINGIHLCKNHPPRQLLINGAAIQEHREIVANARAQREQLAAEQSRLKQKYDRLAYQYAQLEQDLHAARNFDDQCQDALSDLQAQMSENDANCMQVENDSKVLLAEQNQASIELDNARSIVYDLTKMLNSLDYQVQNIQNSLLEAESKLPQIVEPADQQSRLMQLARQELLQEQADIQAQTLSSNQDSINSLADRSVVDRIGYLHLAISELQDEGLEFEHFATSCIRELKAEAAQAGEPIQAAIENLIEKLEVAVVSKLGNVPALIAQHLNIIRHIHAKVLKMYEETDQQLSTFQNNL